MQVDTLHFFNGKWSRPLRDACAVDAAGEMLIICFAAPGFMDSAPLRELSSAWPSARIIGCSTSGEIEGARVCDDSIVAAFVRFERTRVNVATARVVDRKSRDAGVALARQLDAPDLRALLVLSDGLVVNGTELVDGINSVVRSTVSVTGGLAGDGSRFEKTWVLDEKGVARSGIVTAAAFYGDHIDVRHGSKGGWDVFGPERRVTRSKGNVLFELDGKPALELYKAYLGDRASGLPATALLFPLALRRDADGPPVVRTILAVDEQSQSMTFAGDMEEGGTVQLMRANFDRLVQGASDAALMCAPSKEDRDRDERTAASASDASVSGASVSGASVSGASVSGESVSGAPVSSASVLSVAISCVGRRLVLGQRVDEETEATFDALPKGSLQLGYYSYGEISPYVAGGRCDLHNQTMTITTFAER